MTSEKNVRIVLGGIILLGIMFAAGIFVLLMTDRDVPATVYALGGSLFGALTGVLVSTRSSATEPPVQPPVVK